LIVLNLNVVLGIVESRIWLNDERKGEL